MAHLIAWILVLPVAFAWVAASSALWFLFAGFGWKRPAQTVGAGPIMPLERWIARTLRSIDRGLWAWIGPWTVAVYAAVLVLLAVIGYLTG